MLLRFPLLSIYANVLVNAVRRDEEIDALKGISVDAEDASADLTDALQTSKNASVGEQLSAEDMQHGLLDFLNNARWKYSFPDLRPDLDLYARKILEKLPRRKSSNARSCQEQLGGLLTELTTTCKLVIETESRSSCPESVKSIFLHGASVVLALQMGPDLVKNAAATPRLRKPLLDAGYFLKRWIIEQATAKKAAILWAGFWTNASDPDGHRSRTSKERLYRFADLIETQTVHPSTKLGQLAEKYDNLAACQGPKENEVKGNMWSFFSFSFVSAMRKKEQDVVVALVHKAMDGERPLDQSILFQYEVPAIGIASWGFGFWSPQVVLIDLLGTCNQTSPALRKQLYSVVGSYRSFTQSREDFVLRSRLSWTCLDCPHSHCHLDEHLAKQVKLLLQAKRKQDQKGSALTKAAKTGKVSKVKKLLYDGADVNFQDQDGNTPLFFAVNLSPGPRRKATAKATATATAKAKATAKALLDKGANVDAKNKWGETPLAAAMPFPGLRHLLETSKNHGADANAKYKLSTVTVGW